MGIDYFNEIIASKDETIRSLNRTIAIKDETIKTMSEHLDDLRGFLYDDHRGNAKLCQEIHDMCESQRLTNEVLNAPSKENVYDKRFFWITGEA